MNGTTVEMRCGSCRRFLGESPAGGRVYCHNCKGSTNYSPSGSEGPFTPKR